jgi:superfamily II DNA/RNA helicase
MDLKQAIVFTATKRDADTLADNLSAQGHVASALHGDMNQRERNRTLTKLRHGTLRILVATDVAARGIDVAGITHVINFDLPKFAEDYVHRIGRTGRAGASGIAVSFASGKDSIHLKKIERFTGHRITSHTIPGLEPRSKSRSGDNGTSRTTPTIARKRNRGHSWSKDSNGRNFSNSNRNRTNDRDYSWSNNADNRNSNEVNGNRYNNNNSSLEDEGNSRRFNSAKTNNYNSHANSWTDNSGNRDISNVNGNRYSNHSSPWTNDGNRKRFNDSTNETRGKNRSRSFSNNNRGDSIRNGNSGAYVKTK